MPKNGATYANELCSTDLICIPDLINPPLLLFIPIGSNRILWIHQLIPNRR